jgi:hypothetical protein
MKHREENKNPDGMRSIETRKGIATCGVKPDDACEDILDGPLPAG